MKRIEFVKVDAGDGRPATQFPCRNGPKNPFDGITILWWSGRNPAHYFGTVADDVDTNMPGVLREIDAGEWAALTEDWRDTILGRLADYRFGVETGGIEIDGQRILTDRESQAQLTGAYQALSTPLVDSIDWKGATGWITVTETELRPIAQAVTRHVQGAFTAERRVSEVIAAADTAEALVAINWRSQFDSELEAVKAAQAEATTTA